MQQLTALKHPKILDIISNHKVELFKLVRGIGSPLHFIFPEIFSENINNFKNVLLDADVEFSLFFAKKANKADSFIDVCREHEIGVDVASIGELCKTISLGIKGNYIGVSGPEKDMSLLQLAINHDCLITIDSLSELEKILYITKKYNKKCRILCRAIISKYEKSRFGLDHSELEQALEICLSNSNYLELLGFSFHLSGYDLIARAKATDFLIDWCLKAKEIGLTSCNCVNIGGGFPIQYISQNDWDAFQIQDTSVDYHAHKNFKEFYPYSSTCIGANSLKAILNFEIKECFQLKQKLKQYGIHLILEPGRALLDQAGFTAFRVQGIKTKKLENEQYAILTVEGSSFSLSEQWFNTEFLPDPILLSLKKTSNQKFIACVAGSTCLESDMLSWRKIIFEHVPNLNDLCIYLNTAGYQMDSNESTFHESKIPLKVVIQLSSEKFEWHLDHQVSQNQFINFTDKKSMLHEKSIR